MKIKKICQLSHKSPLNFRSSYFLKGQASPITITPLYTAMVGLIFIFTPGKSHGQTVPLGSAWDFAIISSQGLTNSGLTTVDGDVALSPLQTITGFNGYGTGGLGVIDGTVNFNDTRAQNAQSDALTAYNTLAGKSYLESNNLSANSDLGGITLTPGVYHFDSSASITGTLTLDTLGDPDAVFIFQVGSTLTTAIGSNVNVIGAGGNVYWQVGSSATINADSNFKGNIIALTSVSFGTGANLTDGRAVALNGAVTLLSNSLSTPPEIMAAPGQYWNGNTNDLWTEENWSASGGGVDDTPPDVVFNGTEGADTVLGADLEISSLTVNDTGAVTIGGDNTLTISSNGRITGININPGAGLVTIDSDLVLGNLSQVVDVENADGLVINGTIGGSNGLTKTGTGRLTITGDSTYTDATVVSGGTLQIGDGATAGSSIASSDSVLVSNAIGEMSVLAINLASGEEFGNSVTNNGRVEWIASGANSQAPTSVFSGEGTMLVSGAGVTSLSGANTFTGGTTINTRGSVLAGTPAGNNSSAFGTGPLNIVNGRIDTVNSAPLTISTGDFNQSGGLLNLFVDGTAPGTFTNFQVDGNVNLSGGTVSLYNEAGTYIPQSGDVQSFIQGDSLTGMFASNLPSSSLFNPILNRTVNYAQGSTLLYPTITYDGNSASILWIQDSFAFSSELTQNQASVAAALNNSSGPLVDFLLAAPVGNLAGIFDRIAPDEMTSMFQMGIQASEIQNSNIILHLQQARQSARTIGATTYKAADTTDAKSGLTGGSADSKGGLIGGSADSKGGLAGGSALFEKSNRWSVFVEATHGSASLDSTANASGYDLDSDGVTIGADMRVNNRLIVGVLGAYDDRNANLSNAGSIDSNGYRGAVFATYFQDNFFVDALVGAGTSSYDTRRAALGGFASGETDGWELSSLLNAGYNINRGAWTLTPHASIAYTRVALDSFTETGSLSPLSYPDQDQDSLRSELGVNLSYGMKVGGIVLTPQVNLAWQHEYLDDSYTINSSFAGGSTGPGFITNGSQNDRDRAIYGIGLAAQITPDLSVYAYYSDQVGSSDYQSSFTTIGLKYYF
ncbi:autotransporter domain-containing protein [Luteolibacter sp. AS25]|uniref:autotransporter domain-containing protein n=1 Tax=Luteolibacter sp. AS25 TaxID=3135776 RepID=UPI00398B1DAC